eukprot:Phypoly_transcript_20084.p1 GENE.Phypoly_transcript_20084~~Phypoly_transcript_20084.p1  ORF type:complete len:158 (+),score=18.96 Phypoly_transcript_20084:124-597(+)
MGLKGFYRAMVIMTAVFVALLSVPYFVYLKHAADQNPIDRTAIIIYSISAFVFLLVGFLGLFGGIRKNKNVTRQFATMAAMMFIFELVQVILTAVSFSQCNNHHNPLIATCGTSKLSYFLPSAFQLLATLLAAIFGFLYFLALREDEGGSSTQMNIY